MDFETLEKKILQVLNNLETVKVTNKIKAEAIRMEIETLLLRQQNNTSVVGETNASHQTH